MSAPFFFFFFEKKTVLFCQCLCLVVSFIRPRGGGGHTRKRFKNHRRAEEGAKGQKKVEKTPKFVSRRKKKGKKKETRAQLPQKKEKKETHAPLIFLNESLFFFRFLAIFSQGSLSLLLPYLLPFCCRAVVKRERERERE